MSSTIFAFLALAAIATNIQIISGASLSKSGVSCVQQPRDIFLVVDGSASIGTDNFKKVRKFLIKFVSSIDISSTSSHLGLLQFSDDRNVRIELDLHSPQNKSNILGKIRNINYQAGSDTRTDLGLKKVSEKIFTKTGGDRPNVEDLLIVFTDGNSRKKHLTIENADELKRNMVRILAIGAGKDRLKFKDELEKIATSPEDVLMVKFDDLDDIVKTLVGEVCTIVTTLLPPATTTVSLPTTIPTRTTRVSTSVPTSTPKPTTLSKPTRAPVSSVCSSSRPKNVLFIVDGTANSQQYWKDARKEFGKIKSFLGQVVSELQDDKFRVGIMQFGGRRSPKMEINFLEGRNTVQVMSRLQSIQQRRGSQRNTGEALMAASYKLYEMNTDYDRHNVQDVIILITRGQAWDRTQTKSEIKMLRLRNVRVITIGVGPHPKYMADYLKGLANPGDVYLAKYNQLQNSASNILGNVCSQKSISFYKSAEKHPGEECGKIPYDVFFVVDGSASIKHKNFKMMRKFIMDMLVLLKTMSSDMNIGLMQFSEQSKTQLLLELGKHSTVSELDLIRKMKYQSGKQTMTGDALSRVYTEVFTGQRGDRSNVQDILFLITDGNAHDFRKAQRMAQLIKYKDVRVVTIAAGERVSVGKLRKLASGPKYSLKVNFSDLAGFAQKVISRVCRVR